MQISHNQFISISDQNLQDRTVTSRGNKPVTTFETNEYWQNASVTSNEKDDLFGELTPSNRLGLMVS